MSDRTDIKIFFASSGELKEEREESLRVLTNLNKRYPHLYLEPLEFEIDTPSGNVPRKKRVQDGITPLLNEAHIVVVLFYSKVGEFTKEEFEQALAQEKKVYLYLKEGFTPKTLEDGKNYLQVLELKDKVEKESALRYQSYNTLSDYSSLLYRDLEKYIDDTYPAETAEPSATISTSWQHIPLAPRPYLAHPYSIVKNFTGRREEMTRLTEWFKFEKEPMCIIEAIGGMGKSALCWKWLQDEIIAKDTKVEGIIWWSFYDQGFEEFIHHMYEYCIPETVRNRQQRIDETTEVLKALTTHRYLLILDGFERVLKGYAQMMAMYIQEEGLSRKNIAYIKEAFDIQQRTPITPKAEKLLRTVCTGYSKTLMTTRLYPATVEGLAGIKHIRLTGLSKTDTIAFFKTEEITGTEEEMIRAGEVYSFHPLMLKLLSTAIKRSFSRNINKALEEAFSKGLIDKTEPQKILATSYRLLNADEQKVASTISVFRTAFTFDAAKALFPDMESDKLEGILIELCYLGFILYNEQQHIFDFHPILRSYLYDGLTGKDSVHELAITYFNALPAKEKIITLADLEPAIEQYHHLTRAGRYDDAGGLFRDRLSMPLFFQFGQYNLYINLCLQLFTSTSDLFPQVSSKRLQGYILSGLGLCYAKWGNTDKAIECIKNDMTIDSEAKDFENLATAMHNLTDLTQIPSARLTSAIIQTNKILGLKVDDPARTADTHRMLATILAARCQYIYQRDPIIESNLKTALEISIKDKYYGLASWVCHDYTKWAIALVFNKENTKEEFQEVLSWGQKAAQYAEQDRNISYPSLHCFISAYSAMSGALIFLIRSRSIPDLQSEQIFFYDEHFQNIICTEIPDVGNYSILAERCILEGLTLTRKTNRLFDEANFSLLHIQLEWLKIKDKQKETERFPEVEKLIVDTHSLATRIGFRMFLADLHLFCAETLLDLRQSHPNYKHKLINLSALEHLEKTREYAKDTSTLEDLFLPPDADDFYKDIPEYTMLKRGLTEEEQIKNGYYTAWLRADELQKRIIS